MSKFLLSALLIAATVMISSCSDEIVSECETDIKVVVEPNFTSIQNDLFTPNCATSGCHAGANAVLGMDLSEGNAYNAIVGINSTQSSKNLIEPGNAEASYIVDKLRGRSTSQMPPGGSISEESIRAVEIWINSGAENN